jgi:hypothetical protein
MEACEGYFGTIARRVLRRSGTISRFGKTPFSPFRQNLVKPPRRRFLHYVVDSPGEINLLIWRIYPMPYDIIVL